MNKCYIIQISTWCQSEVDHQIYYSESDYILFLQVESVIGPGSLWIHILLEGEISGKFPYGQSLYEKYFVLMNFRLELV